ncbi:MAG: cache domain-containing protein [Lachnospiraceae bacterium]|nr:cache domain-containing protein [Lachnospiraceae bacterium]
MTMKKKILLVAIAPVLLIGLAVIIITMTGVRSSLLQEVEESLRATAAATLAAYDQNAGEYLQAENGDIWKGGYNISRSETLVDNIKERSGMDVTFFYGDRRVMTSAVDESGDRILGSPAGEAIVEKVLMGGEEYFSQAVSLDGVINYGYYIPVYQKGDSGSPIGMIFVGTNKSEKDKAVNRILYSIIAVVSLGMAIAVAVAVLTALSITASLRKSIRQVEIVAGGNLSGQADKKLVARRDEIGDLSRALQLLQTELTRVIAQISDNTREILQAAGQLGSMAGDTSHAMQGVEDAMHVISQGAREQAQNTEMASANIGRIGDGIQETSREVQLLGDNAEDMRISSEKAAVTMEELQSINQEVENAIAVIEKQTHDTNEAAQRIKEAAAMITEIAEETNLLSLNASIEAARAGEAGRGFAVVASQIQKLAEQSNESSKVIEEIIGELIENSDKTVETMGKVSEIIGSQSRNLTETEEVVRQVTRGINVSMASIGQIEESTARLDRARQEVIQAVAELSQIAQQNADSTQNTSSAVGRVVDSAGQVSDNAARLKNVADSMAESIRHFQI